MSGSSSSSDRLLLENFLNHLFIASAAVLSHEDIQKSTELVTLATGKNSLCELVFHIFLYQIMARIRPFIPERVVEYIEKILMSVLG